MNSIKILIIISNAEMIEINNNEILDLSKQMLIKEKNYFGLTSFQIERQFRFGKIYQFLKIIC